MSTLLAAPPAQPQLVAAVPAHEGPVHDPAAGVLYVTTVPRPGGGHGRGPGTDPVNDVLRIRLDGARAVSADAVSVVATGLPAANGMTLDADGTLLVCEQGGWASGARAAITRLDPATGRRTVVVDSWQGLPLNSPNDVAVAGDGAIWFTDPTYGSIQGFRPPTRTGDLVYRHDPATGETAPVADDLDKPNGLAFSPDGRTLYIADSGANQEPGSFDPRRPHHVVAYEVLDGRRLGPQRLFAVIPSAYPDGLTVDPSGRVIAVCSVGVLVHAPDGRLLETLPVPGAVTCALAGCGLLLVTTDTAVQAVALPTTQLSGE